MSAVANSCFGVNQHPRDKSCVLLQCEAPCARHVRGNSSTSNAQTAVRCAVSNSCFGVKQHARAKCAKSRNGSVHVPAVGAVANSGFGVKRQVVRRVVRQVAQAAGRCAAANSLFGVKHHARAKLHTTGAQTAAACAVAN